MITYAFSCIRVYYVVSTQWYHLQYPFKHSLAFFANAFEYMTYYGLIDVIFNILLREYSLNIVSLYLMLGLDLWTKYLLVSLKVRHPHVLHRDKEANTFIQNNWPEARCMENGGSESSSSIRTSPSKLFRWVGISRPQLTIFSWICCLQW